MLCVGYDLRGEISRFIKSAIKSTQAVTRKEQSRSDLRKVNIMIIDITCVLCDSIDKGSSLF